MPITISVKDFKDQTRSSYYQRPAPLKATDTHLADYYQERNFRNKDLAHTDVIFIVRELERWSAGKTLETVNGVTRFRDRRDRTGIIKRLLDQARQTVAEYERMKRTAQLAAAQDTASNAGSSAPPNSIGERDSFADQFRPVSLGTFRSSVYTRESERDSYHKGAAPVGDRRGPTGGFSISAFDAAADFIQRVTYADVSGLDIGHAVSEVTNASPVNITLSDIMRGIEELGYGDQFFLAQHCTWDHVMRSMLGITPTKPMMVGVGGDNPPFRAVVCYGYQPSINGQRTIKATDGVTPEGYCTMFEDGNFMRNYNGTLNDEMLLPSLGYIKALR